MISLPAPREDYARKLTRGRDAVRSPVRAGHVQDVLLDIERREIAHRERVVRHRSCRRRTHTVIPSAGNPPTRRDWYAHSPRSGRQMLMICSLEYFSNASSPAARLMIVRAYSCARASKGSSAPA